VRLKTFLVLLLLFLLPATLFAADNINVQAYPDINPRLIAKFYNAVDATEAFYRQNYGITLGKPVDIFLVATKEDYVKTVSSVLKVSPATAEHFARYNKGVSAWNIVSYGLNDRSSDRTIYSHIAHELTHTYQQQLASSKPSGKMTWLWEGMSNVMAARIVAEQGILALDDNRHYWLAYQRKQTYSPQLMSLTTQAGWFDAMDYYGSTAVYNYATLATDYLVRLKGDDALIEYVRLSKQMSGSAAFKAAFGLSLDDFARRFEEYIGQQPYQGPI
jgi:hypothetical protein